MFLPVRVCRVHGHLLLPACPSRSCVNVRLEEFHPNRWWPEKIFLGLQRPAPQGDLALNAFPLWHCSSMDRGSLEVWTHVWRRVPCYTPHPTPSGFQHCKLGWCSFVPIHMFFSDSDCFLFWRDSRYSPCVPCPGACFWSVARFL